MNLKLTVLFVFLLGLTIFIACQVNTGRESGPSPINNGSDYIDELPPQVDEVITSKQADNNLCNIIEIAFDEPIDPVNLSVENFFITEKDGSPVSIDESTFRIDTNETNKVYFELAGTSELTDNEYELIVSNVKDLFGNTVDSFETSFGSCGNDMEAPRVTLIETETPFFGALEGTRILVHFDKPIDMSTVEIEDFLITNAVPDPDAGRDYYTNIISVTAYENCKNDTSVLEIITEPQEIGNKYVETEGNYHGHGLRIGGTTTSRICDVFGNCICYDPANPNAPECKEHALQYSYVYSGSEVSFDEAATESYEDDEPELNNEWADDATELGRVYGECILSKLTINGSLRYVLGVDGTPLEPFSPVVRRDSMVIQTGNATCCHITFYNDFPDPTPDGDPETKIENYWGTASLYFNITKEDGTSAFSEIKDGTASFTQTVEPNTQWDILVTRDLNTREDDYAYGRDYKIEMNFTKEPLNVCGIPPFK